MASSLISIPTSTSFTVQTRNSGDSHETWNSVVAYATDVASANTSRNEFDKHSIAVASLQVEDGKSTEFRVNYTSGVVSCARIRPVSRDIKTIVEDDHTIRFSLHRATDVMLEINNNKWEALHILVNTIEIDAPTGDSENLWYFGPGINKGRAYDKVIDGNIEVPSDTTVYLAPGAFVTAKFIFREVSGSSIRGHGFIHKEHVVHSSSPHPRELTGSAILIERSRDIIVEGVVSLGAKGFSLPIGQSENIRVDRYRSFSCAGNGDGIDLFCCRNVLVQNCFLRNSDDTIAIYGHRWDYYGDTSDVQIKDCVLLPEIAHPIHVGTHGNPQEPETFSDIRISNIDILDHLEHQMWYQGCLSLNAGDENLIENVLIEDIRVEKISKGQLLNIRVMKNAMWTTAPGRGVRNVVLRNIYLDTETSEKVYPSQILGFDGSRRVENVTIENLKIGNELVHDGSRKPRWYMVSDIVPMFINEHVENVTFSLSNDGR